jgi:uncharacterized protein YdeI (YjbR/CyaY-like superfamily)
VSDVPPTASDHPSTWKFDYPIYHVETREQWRAWLAVHQDDPSGVWVATWNRDSGRPAVTYDELVEEALCVGWIDSTVNTLDADRRLQLVTPRKPRSTWSRVNKARVEQLEADGRMRPRGRRAIEAARENGWWSIYDAVEDLVEPDDLAAALDAEPEARAAWDAFPTSPRKAMLWWVVSAVREDTRARGVASIVDHAARGERAQG